MKYLLRLAFLSALFFESFSAATQDYKYDWALTFGPGAVAEASHTHCDQQGNLIVVGSLYRATDLDPGPSEILAEGSMYMQKFDPNGNLLWAFSLGAELGGDVGIAGLDLDNEGNIYLAGHFHGTTDLDPSANVFMVTASTQEVDAFLLKLDPSGNFVWANVLGTADPDVGTVASAMMVDANGDILLLGKYRSTIDLDPGPGVFNVSGGASITVYLARFTSDGTFLSGGSIGVGGSLNLVHIGQRANGDFDLIVQLWGAYPTDLDPGAGVFELEAPENEMSVVMLTLDQSMNFMEAKVLYSSIRCDAAGVVFGDDGSTYISGGFLDTCNFDPGTTEYEFVMAGENWNDWDIYILKLAPDDQLDWAIQLGGEDRESASGMAIDNSGNVYVIGNVKTEIDLDPDPIRTFTTASEFNSEEYRAFALKLDPNGKLLWAEVLESDVELIALDINVDNAGHIYVLGTFSGTADFDPLHAQALLTATDSISNIWGMNSASFIQKLDSFALGGSCIDEATIYPNPSNGEFMLKRNISSVETSIHIFDTKGREIAAYDQVSCSSCSFDLSDLKAGIYYMQLGSERNSCTYPFIKQ
jgi:hypothetical protein